MSETQVFGKVRIEPLTRYSGTDLDDLCEATESAIVEGGGFGWLKPPPRQVLENYWKGVLLVPERRLVVGEVEQLARELGLLVLNLDLRDTQRAAIHLYETLGYRRYGTHPFYALVDGDFVPGHYYYKRLDEPVK